MVSRWLKTHANLSNLTFGVSLVFSGVAIEAELNKREKRAKEKAKSKAIRSE